MCQPAPFVCPKCCGWGQLADGGPCPVCKGERLVWPAVAEELRETVTAIVQARAEPTHAREDYRLADYERAKRARLGKGRPRRKTA